MGWPLSLLASILRQSRRDRVAEKSGADERGKAWTENPERSRD